MICPKCRRWQTMPEATRRIINRKPQHGRVPASNHRPWPQLVAPTMPGGSCKQRGRPATTDMPKPPRNCPKQTAPHGVEQFLRQYGFFLQHRAISQKRTAEWRSAPDLENQPENALAGGAASA